jgi:N-acetylneuraminate synthase
MNIRSIGTGKRFIGDSHPVYVIAEIGINHNGSVDIAKKMIEGAAFAGCDAVKFQKRTPELCVPRDQWDIMRETPWGRISYIEYRHKMEFDKKQYEELISFCNQLGIDWFASCWDENAVDFIRQFDPPLYKIASACLTDDDLLIRHKELKKPVILSTGMSSMEEITKAISLIGLDNLLIAHSTSSYPCRLDELNLHMISTYRNIYPANPIGYSGHETGLAPSWTAVALGANFIERHITLDRSMWGTDQAASVEVVGMWKLVTNIRDIEKALGNGIKKVYDSELSAREKLRRIKQPVNMSRVI